MGHDEYNMPDASPDPTSDTPPKKRRFRLRYSLRSLLLFMLLFSAALALWRDWSPWHIEYFLKGHEGGINPAAFSPDGRRIVTASYGDDHMADDHTARVWDSQTGRELCVMKSHQKSVWSAAFSPDGRHIVTASDDKTARVWRRVRPEWWWGVFWLPQFWAVVLLAPAFIWSLWRDYKRLMLAPAG